MVAEVGKEFVDAAVFGFLCVIDGVRAMGEDGAVVDFELYCKKGDETVRLNPGQGEFLHDLYNSQ